MRSDKLEEEEVLVRFARFFPPGCSLKVLLCSIEPICISKVSTNNKVINTNLSE